MSRSRSRRARQQEYDLAEVLFWLLLVFGWPYYQQVRAWLGVNQWAMPFAIAITATSVLGANAFLITLYRMQASERRRRLIAMRRLQDLTPSQFEEYVAEIFRAKGYKATVTGRTADGGIDIVLSKDGEQAIAQCKRRKPGNKVGVKDIREFSPFSAAIKRLAAIL